MDTLIDAVGWPRRPRFLTGTLYVTPVARSALAEARQPLSELLLLHQAGDWGCVDQDRALENHKACEVGNDVIAAYVLPNSGETIWICTADIRWYTAVFMASETC